MPLGEFDLIRRFFSRNAPSAMLGSGDDAALLAITPGQVLAVSTDMLLSDRHFFFDADPYLLGRKSLAVNLSDMAAMGAKPRWATLSLALPDANEAWLRPFSNGFYSMADEYGVELVGGDTTKGPLTLCVQIMGEVAVAQALRRDGAKVGDDIWVSGELGAAALALMQLQGKLSLPADELAQCTQRLHDPTPRVALGLALRGIATSAIDLSDGLLADLGHVLQRSNVGAKIQLRDVPCSKALRAYFARAPGQQALLAGGDDYELCFTAPPTQAAAIADIATQLRLPLTAIGQIVAGGELIVQDENGDALDLDHRGFDHFN
jgi:thiamine-monophosphate kinase